MHIELETMEHIGWTIALITLLLVWAKVLLDMYDEHERKRLLQAVQDLFPDDHYTDERRAEMHAEDPQGGWDDLFTLDEARRHHAHHFNN